MKDKFFRRFTIITLVFFVIALMCSLTPAQAEDYVLSRDNVSFLRKIERDTIEYFLRYSDSGTGLTRDSSMPGAPASIAATGFSLACLAIAQDRGWISRKEASRRIEKTLRTLKRRAEHRNGFFYHFLDPRTGRRTWRSEASSIDTALCIAGALVAAQYFQGTDIETMAHQIYKRVDWDWMRNGSDFICMGWTPEGGFLPYYWDAYSELIILQALAIGSPTHPIPARLWERWMRHEGTYDNYAIVFCSSGSLFTYQMSQLFIDFRNLDDEGINYFENSQYATLANRAFCVNNSAKHTGYGEKSWGLTASLGPGGYKAYGARPGNALNDGTIAPYGSAGSLPFTPKESIEALEHFYSSYKDKLYGRYGFVDSFNLNKNWWADEYLGIDQGLIVLAIENLLGGEIWKRFMKLESIQAWIKATELNVSRRSPA